MIAVGDLPTALRAAQLSGISAVVLDVGPGWTRHVTRLLCRGRNGAAPPRIVAVVGETGKALGEAAVELGAAAYITDGVASPARVAQAVRRVMGEPENAPTRAVTAVAVPSVPCYTLPGRGRSLASGTWLDEPVAVSPAMRQRLALAGAAQRCEDRATVGQLGDQGRRRPQSAPVMTTAAWHPVLAADRCAVA
jgi:xanthosine utilization system XapX-like protein